MVKDYPALSVIDGFKVEKTETYKITEVFNKEELIEYLQEEGHSINDVVTDNVSFSFDVKELDDLKRLAEAVGNQELVIDFKDQSIKIYDDYLE